MAAAPPAFSAFAYGGGPGVKAAEAVARRGAVSAAAAAAAATTTTAPIDAAAAASPPPPTGAATPAIGRTRSRTRALSAEPTHVRSSASLRFANDDDEDEEDDDLATTTTPKRPRTLAPRKPPTSSSSATTAAAAAAANPGLGPKLGNGGAPMRLIILGHNPSDTAWATRHYYGHGSNKMYPLLQRVGISPPGTPPGPADDLLPSTAGVGFVDVGTGHPGTHSSSFSSDDFARWRPVFYARLKAHVARASASVGGGQGQHCSCGRCGAPLAVAFAGKRQFQELLALPPMTAEEEARVEGELRQEAEREIEAAAAAAGGGGGQAGAAAPTPTTKQMSKSMSKAAAAAAKKKNNRLPPVELGLQTVLPQGWPLPPSTQVWVVATTSGAAGLTNEAREQSWRAMWREVGREPWPRRVVAGCGGSVGGGDGGGGGAKAEA